jgi:hypothetical protein
MTSNLQSLQFHSFTPPLCHNCALPGKIRSRCRFNNSFFKNPNTITTCSMCLRHGKQYSNCCSTQSLTENHKLYPNSNNPDSASCFPAISEIIP